MSKSTDFLNRPCYIYLSIVLLAVTIIFSIWVASVIPIDRKDKSINNLELQEFVQKLNIISEQHRKEEQKIFREAFEKGILDEETYKEINGWYVDLEE